MWKVGLCLCVLFRSSHPTSLIYGFDCHHPDVKIGAISMAGVLPCREPQRPVEETVPRVQLLQKSLSDSLPYIQCAVSYTETILHCGMHSHTSAVQGGLKVRYRTITKDECDRMHTTKSFSIDHEHHIHDLKVNSTTQLSITKVGHLTVAGECKGATYLSEGLQYHDVVVVSSYTVTLRTGVAKVNIIEDTVILNSGNQVEYKQGHWFDLMYGDTYWDILPRGGCNEHSFQVLYSGPGTLYTEELEGTTRQVIVVQESKKAFALELGGNELLCSQAGRKTEHPSLYVIFITTTNPGYFSSRGAGKTNLDVSLSVYVNAKFVYVERHLRQQMTNLYRHVSRHTCEIRRMALLNTLSLASINEEEFAYAYKGKRGYTAIRRGEVIYLVECIPVPVTIRRTEGCFADLPILYKNSSMFLTPKTGVIKQTGSAVECSSILPSWFYLDNKWYSITAGSAMGNIDPLVLSPNSETEWKYTVPSNLAQSGIYTMDELRSFENRLMFPGERKAVLDVVARGMSGKGTGSQGLSIKEFVTPQDLKDISDSLITRMWGAFSSIGQWTSGFLGVWVVYRLIKTMLSALINGHALYSVFGWSLKLLFCVWSSLTTWALKTTTKDPQDSKITSVVVDNPPDEAKALTDVQPEPTAPLYPSNKVIVNEFGKFYQI
ncbi:MAG: hypothetical protein FOCCV1_gp2 [Fushun oxya chinensis chuvirus 1]|nr:MAG: hypothetical protein FOCCV1_gp2 [Fushun oxya chinensis chuvirus 1]